MLLHIYIQYTADFAKTHAEKFGYKHMLIIDNDKAGGALDEVKKNKVAE